MFVYFVIMATHEGQKSTRSQLFLSFWDTVSQDLGVTDLVRLPSQSIPGFPNAGLQAGASMSNLFYQFGGSNPDPHACIASVSPNGPYLQLKVHIW